MGAALLPRREQQKYVIQRHPAVIYMPHAVSAFLELSALISICFRVRVIYTWYLVLRIPGIPGSIWLLVKRTYVPRGTYTCVP